MNLRMARCATPPIVSRNKDRGWTIHVSDHGGLLRARDEGEQPVTPLELFFDLVFVFAVTQLSHRLLENLTIGSTLGTLLLLVAVWRAWVDTTWVTNWFDPNRTPVRLLLIALMLVSLLMSVAIPQAFGEGGLMFAIAYVTIQVGRTAFVVLALGTNFQRYPAHDSGDHRGGFFRRTHRSAPRRSWDARFGSVDPRGTSLFLAGHALFKWAVFGVLSWSRLAAIAALIALIPVGFKVPVLALSCVAGLIVVGLVAVWDALAYQGYVGP